RCNRRFPADYRRQTTEWRSENVSQSIAQGVVPVWSSADPIQLAQVFDFDCEIAHYHSLTGNRGLATGNFSTEDRGRVTDVSKAFRKACNLTKNPCPSIMTSAITVRDK